MTTTKVTHYSSGLKVMYAMIFVQNEQNFIINLNMFWEHTCTMFMSVLSLRNYKIISKVQQIACDLKDYESLNTKCT